jgi:membrane-bound serine protease (ClpP class)
VLRYATALSALLLGALAFALPAGAADDRDPDTSERRSIAIIEVSGLLDPVEMSYIETRLADAEQANSLVLVLQVNSPGHVVSDSRIIGLLERLSASPVPIAVWVGQAGGRAYGGAAHLVTVADLSAISPGSKIGDFGRLAGADPHPRTVAALDRRLGDDEAVELGVVDLLAPTIGDFLLALEDRGIIDPISATVDREDGLVQRQLAIDVQVEFSKLSLIDQLFHTVASPAVAYLLFVIGLSMILLDFFTGGVGVAGLLGAGCLLLSSYGLWVLETRPWAVAVLVISILAFAVDLQTGVPRFWTAVGVVSLFVGSFALYSGHELSWLALLVGIGLVGSFMFSGMPALIRTRYGTSTLGRDWMIGEMGLAVTDVDPDGMVNIRDAQWRARANRLTPISQGEPVRVVALEGLVLEVEPEEGGAIDYREMRGRKQPVDDGSQSDS